AEILIIILFGLITLTGAFTIADLILQTDFEFPFCNILLTKTQVAGAQREELSDHVQNNVHHTYGSIGSKISRPVLDVFSGPEDSREAFMFDDNPRIGLIIFEHDIITRLMLFDQAIFQKPSINLGVYDGKSNAVDFTDQHTSLAVQLIRIDKIRTHSILQIFCLSDID